MLFGLTTTSLGYQLDLALTAADKLTGEHLLVDVARPDACPPLAPNPAAPGSEPLDSNAWTKAMAETQQLTHRLTEPWDALLLQQAERARLAAETACGNAGMEKSIPGSATFEARSCWLNTAHAWQQAIVKLRLAMDGDYQNYVFSARDLAALGPLAPRIYIVKDRGIPRGGVDVGYVEPNTVLLREAERPLILVLEKQTHRNWHLRKLPSVWLLGWSRTCPQPCPIGRQTVRTIGLGFTLAESPTENWIGRTRGLEVRDVVVPESGTVTIGSGTGEFPDAPAPYDPFANQDVKSAAEPDEAPGAPDRFDRMVEAAAAQSAATQARNRSQSHLDLKIGIQRLPSPVAVRDLDLWSPEVTVTVDHRDQPVFLLLHGAATKSVTVRVRPGSRLAGVFLYKEAEGLALSLPRGVPVFSETASPGVPRTDVLLLLLQQNRGEPNFQHELVAGKSELLLH